MTRSARSLPRWLVRRWHVKLLAGVLAFVTWLIVTTDNRVIQDFSVPADVVVSDDAVLTGERVNRVTLRLRGSAAQFRRIDPLRLGVRIDLRDAPPGQRSVQIETTDVLGVPPSVDITLIDPRVLTFSLARRLRAELTVVPAIEGRPAEGFEVYGVTVAPSTIEVEGPEDQVATLEQVETDPIRIAGRNETFSVRVAARPIEADVRVLDPRLLTVRVDIDEKRVKRTFEGVPVVLVGPTTYDARASAERQTVTVSGPPRLIERLQADQMRVIADVRDLQPRARAYPVAARLELLDVPARDRGLITDESAERRTVSVRVAERGTRP